MAHNQPWLQQSLPCNLARSYYLAPIDSSSSGVTQKALLKLLHSIVSKLRSMKDGEMVVLPAGWTSQSTSSTASGGDAAVPSTSGGGGGNSNGWKSHGGIHSSIRLRYAGATNRPGFGRVHRIGSEYPTYRQPLQARTASIRSSFPTCRPGTLLTPWLALYRGMATPYPSAEEGALCVRSLATLLRRGAAPHCSW